MRVDTSVRPTPTNVCVRDIETGDLVNIGGTRAEITGIEPSAHEGELLVRLRLSQDDRLTVIRP